MLRKLELTYFRRHEHLTVDFTTGLQVIRAANEGGKTTLLEAAAYALFGSKALRTSLSDAVTWGHKETELAVGLDLEIEGQAYRFQRSKKGAEVIRAGQVFVTGQGEVTAFASALLGADAGAAPHLMFAGQGGLRGALEKGPKATAEMIEALANFNTFDRILDRAQEELSLGSTAVLESRLQDLTRRLQELPVVERPDEQAHAEQQQMLRDQAGELGRSLVDVLDPEYRKAYAAWDGECKKRQVGRELSQTLERLGVQIRSTQTQRDEQAATASQTLLPVSQIQETLAAAQAADQRYNAYLRFLKIPDAERVTRVDHNQALASAQNVITLSERTIQEVDANRRVAEAKLITTSVCGYCGQDVSQFPEAAEKNRQLRVELADLEAQRKVAVEFLADAKQKLDVIKTRHTAEDQIIRAAQGLEAFVKKDETVCPVAFTWVGEVPESGLDEGKIEALKAKIQQAQSHNAKVTKAQAQVEALDQVLARDMGERDRLMAQHRDLALLSEETYQALDEACLAATAKKANAEAQLKQLSEDLKSGTRAWKEALDRWQVAQHLRTTLQDQASTTEKDITTTQFNNALLKKIRTARPIVSNKLWNLVLTSVSNLFSKLRGEVSKVTKGDGGFLVNGQAVESLSGSTLDLLGLAIRVALVKTFLPSCPLLILDEPTAACDADRTANLVGFVASAGFEQVILVTHEDTSESVANNLIQW